ncbi:MAG: magnesium/cobalt transporter CorA [Saprospiraceae bacterium]|nr:magnesium/cobalt transporter CorA [Saprospiraceae bacterium]
MSKKNRTKPGTSPGTLIFTGNKKLSEPNVTLVQYDEADYIERHEKNHLPSLRPGRFLNWYDIRGLHQINLIEQIGKQFNIHQLALEDVLDTQQRPKFEEYDNGIFITIQALTYDPEQIELKTEQISIFSGQKVVVSFQEDENELFIPIRERISASKGRIRRRGADYLTYALLDLIVDNYFLILDQVEDSIEQLEVNIVQKQDNNYKNNIHQLKIVILKLKKIISPLREAVSQFSRCDENHLDSETSVFVRDLYDHIIQLIDMVDTYRDIITGLQELYLAEISLRMNNVMQVLTIISTIFIPLTFLVGVYGMNFDTMPELHWSWSYYALWAVMLALVLFMVHYFKRKKWL